MEDDKNKTENICTRNNVACNMAAEDGHCTMLDDLEEETDA